MSLLQKVGILGVISLLAACASPAAFPDISDEENGRSAVLTASDGLVSEGALRASEPEIGPDEEELMAAERKAAMAAAAENSKTASDDEDLMSDEEFLSKAEKLEATKTKPVEKSEVVAENKKYEDVFKAAEEEKEDSAENNGPSVTYRLETFYFANGSSVLENENMARIREIVKIAKQNKGKLRVVGYASSRTRNTDIATHKLANFKVSQERADSVAKALRRAGIPAQNITVEALSDSNPAYLEVMPEGERLNRRAEVYISY